MTYRNHHVRLPLHGSSHSQGQRVLRTCWSFKKPWTGGTHLSRAFFGSQTACCVWNRLSTCRSRRQQFNVDDMTQTHVRKSHSGGHLVMALLFPHSHSPSAGPNITAINHQRAVVCRYLWGLRSQPNSRKFWGVASSLVSLLTVVILSPHAVVQVQRRGIKLDHFLIFRTKPPGRMRISGLESSWRS